MKKNVKSGENLSQMQSKKEDSTVESSPSVEKFNEAIYALANHLYERGMLEQSFKQMKLVATEGEYAPAMFDLGMYYLRGIGTEKNAEEALTWLKKAAEKGDDYAAYNVGALYQDGKYVARSFDEAKRWYELSAQMGNEMAVKELEFFKEALNVHYVLCGKDTFANEDFEVKHFWKLKDAEQALNEHMDAAGRHSPDTKHYDHPGLDLRDFYWIERRLVF